MERLQKVLAQAGIASRRAAEQIILAGRVRVDGKVVRELGTQVDPRKNRVEVDGSKIVAEKQVYIVLHKPRGVVCTLSDPEGRPTIAELLKDAGARVVPVGRLDFHTSGALICTNDGEFAHGLAHPKKHVPKVYVAKVQGAVDDEALDKFGERIVIDGRATQPAQVKRLRFEGEKTWLEITLSEGRNRQVRRLGEATGFPVMRLARISHAGVTSEDLRPGQWRPLSLDELIALKRDYGVPKKVRAPAFEPALGKGGWDEQPRTPGARRPDPKFSAASRRDAKPKTDGPRFDRRRPAPPGREGLRGELTHGVSHDDSDRRSARARIEARPSTSSTRASAERASTPRDRGTLDPRREGKQAPAKPLHARQAEKYRSKPGPAELPRFDRARAPSRNEQTPRDEAVPFARPRRQEAPRDEPARFARPRRQDDLRPPVAKPFNAAHREKKRFDAKNAEPNAKRAARPGREAPFDGRRAERASTGRGHEASHAKPLRSQKATAQSDGRGSAPRRGTSR